MRIQIQQLKLMRTRNLGFKSMQNVDGELEFQHPESEAITSDIQAFMPFVKRFREAKLAARFVNKAKSLLWMYTFFSCARSL
jgi:hypothetical protein